MRIFRPSFLSMPRLTRSSTQIRLLASRRREVLRRSGSFGNRSARPARQPAPCWFRRPPNSGRSSRQGARPRMEGSRIRRAGASFPMACWRRARTAKRGLDALEIDWDEGPNARISSKDIWENLRAASEKDGVIAKSEGDIVKGLATGDRLDAAYELPFLAHATMEPLSATVHVKPDSCEIWTGTQIMARVQSEAAKAAGLLVEKVIVNNHLIGGGFGRKLEPDMVVAAVRVAKQVDGPVKVVWMREEDIQHDIYRPVYRDTIAATLSDGKIVGWKYKVSGAAIIARWLPPAFQKGIDIDAIDSAVDMPYDIPNFHVEYVRAEPPAVPTGFWRGVGANNNVFAIECFMDELARKAGKDPIEFRRGMLGKNPRLLAALNLVAEKSRSGPPLAAPLGPGA